MEVYSGALFTCTQLCMILRIFLKSLSSVLLSVKGILFILKNIKSVFSLKHSRITSALCEFSCIWI